MLFIPVLVSSQWWVWLAGLPVTHSELCFGKIQSEAVIPSLPKAIHTYLSFSVRSGDSCKVGIYVPSYCCEKEIKYVLKKVCSTCWQNVSDPKKMI